MGPAQAVTDRPARDQRAGYARAGTDVTEGVAPGAPAAIGIAHRNATACPALGVGPFAILGPVSCTTSPSVRRSTSTDPSWSVR